VKRTHLDRRALLRGAGGIAIGLPFLEAMQPRGAHAGATVPAKRLVIIFSPNATNDPASFMPAQTGPSFVLPKETAPLEALHKQLLVVSGVNMESAKKDSTGDLHSVGMSHMLTGIEWVQGTGFTLPGGLPVGFAGGISVDQYVANKVGSATRFSSLEFGAITITDYGVHPFGRMISAGKNQPVPPEDDPSAMFKRIFGDVAAGSDPGMAQILAQRRSVLDFVIDDVTRLETRLGPKDKQRVDQHLTAVRSLETRLSKTGNTTCGADKTAPVVMDPQDKSKFDVLVKLQTDLLVLALQCDVTRVASLQMSWARSMLSHPWINVNDNHHTMTHGPATDILSSINTWYAKQVAYLGTSMAAVDDGNGKTLLDNSMVYWCGECARGYDHDFNNIRVFILGSGGGAIQTGQHIKVNNEPHNKLLVTLMNAMGVPDTQFGDPQFGTGPLPGIAV
jgi:hypothetical protein